MDLAPQPRFCKEMGFRGLEVLSSNLTSIYDSTGDLEGSKVLTELSLRACTVPKSMKL